MSIEANMPANCSQLTEGHTCKPERQGGELSAFSFVLLFFFS